MGKKLDLKKQNKQKQLSVLTSSAGSVRMWTQQLVVELQPLTPAAAEFHQRQHRTFSLVCFNNSLGARCLGYCSLWVCVRLTRHRPATDRVWGRDLGWVNLLNNSSATSCLNQGSEQHTLSVQVKPRLFWRQNGPHNWTCCCPRLDSGPNVSSLRCEVDRLPAKQSPNIVSSTTTRLTSFSSTCCCNLLELSRNRKWWSRERSKITCCWLTVIVCLLLSHVIWMERLKQGGWNETNKRRRLLWCVSKKRKAETNNILKNHYGKVQN